MDTGELLGDEAHILYVNGAYRATDPLGKLMHDFACTDAKDMNYPLLANRVRFFKETEEGMNVMCRAMEEMRNQAVKAAMIEIALRMFAEKFPEDVIARISGLSMPEIVQLRNSLA